MSDDSGLVDFISTGVTLNYVSAVAATSMAYDIAISIFDEVKYVWWGMRWSLPKILYIFARYYCPLYILAETILPINIAKGPVTLAKLKRIASCAVWFHGCAGLVIISSTIDLIFIFRVSAIYGNSKKAVLFIAQFATACTVTLIVTISESQNQVVVPGFGCATSTASPPVLQTAAFIILFILTIIRARIWSVSKELGGIINVLSNRRNEFPLLTSVLRDGTLYFFLLFVSTIPATLGAVDPPIDLKLDFQAIYLRGSIIYILLCSFLYILAVGISINTEPKKINRLQRRK
ncbi:hypothetical protein BDQ17DRAFT_1435602 [Cyathus striatus]|nr:hypothetical protein BDQ17DRAFT_1435602 [Cyathus striatus]